MNFMKQKVWDLKDWEVLQVIHSSDSRRFQVQVARPEGPNATWKGLPSMPVSCRTYQGHNRALMKKAQILSLMKEVYTLDPEYTAEKLDAFPPCWPRTNKGSSLVRQLSEDRVSQLRPIHSGQSH